jgi:hypothetical protein
MANDRLESRNERDWADGHEGWKDVRLYIDQTPELAALLSELHLLPVSEHDNESSACDQIFTIANHWRERELALVTARSETQARKGWAIRHVDGRWRTMDTLGMPDWTDDQAKALCCRLREHVDAYAADDPDDVRIVEVDW